MVKSNNELLEQIRLERIESLKLVRESITSNQGQVSDNIANAVSLISKDEVATKHLQTIIKAKEMIASLMTKAALATTDEELTAVRKRLNYYLNKVKNEIQKRNVSEVAYNKYYQSVTYLREDISECLRVMRRQVKLDRLSAVINSGDLTVEELREIKKDLNNEKRFNKRLLAKYGTSDGVKRNLRKSSSETKKTPLPNIGVPQQDFKETHEESHELPTLNKADTWQSCIKTDYNRYNVETPHEYGESLLKNIGILFSNMGIYFRNNDRVKQMLKDYNLYLHSESLKRLICYTQYNNSIKGILHNIFRNTALGNYESERTNEHRQYMEEIHQAINYRQENLAPELVKI